MEIKAMHPMWDRIDPLVPAFLADESTEITEEIVQCLERVFFDWFLARLQLGSNDVEDLAARSVERIVIYRHQFADRGQGSFRAWCYRIAENIFHDWASEERTWGARTASDEEWQVLEGTMSIVETVDSDDYETPAAVSVRNVFQMLTALEQAALVMFEIDRLRDEEIAEALNSTTDRVKQARYRARKKFRLLLSADARFAHLSGNSEQGEQD